MSLLLSFRLFKNRRTLCACHIYQMLKKASKRPHLSFHTPGHKIGKFDITELCFSDNLASPKGCIRRAEEDIAALSGAEKSFILTDGSTSGVFSMLYAAKVSGVKTIAFSTPAHKSVYNACALLRLNLLPFKSVEDEALENADALFLTSPTYYGEVPDLKQARGYCDKTGKLLLIDGAHGGHLRYQKQLYAGSYADIWVDGVHKSLPALTQGAVVSASKKELVEPLRAAVDIFRTSSPSYPIMASTEYAVKYPRNRKLETQTENFKKQYPLRLLQNEDWTKLCARFPSRAFEAEKTLERMGVYPEFCDGDILMFYLSPATSKRDFLRLQKTLRKLFSLYPLNEKDVGRVALNDNQTKNGHTMYENNETGDETERIALTDSENRICATNYGLFPPCTPLIYTGDRITSAQIEKLRTANHTFGITDGKILVYKEKNNDSDNEKNGETP